MMSPLSLMPTAPVRCQPLSAGIRVLRSTGVPSCHRTASWMSPVLLDESAMRSVPTIWLLSLIPKATVGDCTELPKTAGIVPGRLDSPPPGHSSAPAVTPPASAVHGGGSGGGDDVHSSRYPTAVP